jgi:hypothetical protein
LYTDETVDDEGWYPTKKLLTLDELLTIVEAFFSKNGIEATMPFSNVEDVKKAEESLKTNVTAYKTYVSERCSILPTRLHQQFNK